MSACSGAANAKEWNLALAAVKFGIAKKESGLSQNLPKEISHACDMDGQLPI